MAIGCTIGLEHLDVRNREHPLIAQNLSGALPFEAAMTLQVLRRIRQRNLFRLRLHGICRTPVRIALPKAQVRRRRLATPSHLSSP
jgi:hypothetical protein